MAVWLSIFGENGLGNYDQDKVDIYKDILNAIPVDRIKIFDSLLEAGYTKSKVEDYYRGNRNTIASHLKTRTPAEYKEYLDSIRQPYIEIDALIDLWIAEGIKNDIEIKRKFELVYESALSKNESQVWKAGYNDEGSATFINDLGLFDNDDSGLRVIIMNDLVDIILPSYIASGSGDFQNAISEQSREWYHSFLKTILRDFKSNFILYADEWSGLYEGDNTALTSWMH